MISAAGENNVLLGFTSLNARRLPTLQTLLADARSGQLRGAFDLSLVQPGCRCTNQNVSVLVSVNFPRPGMNIELT